MKTNENINYLLNKASCGIAYCFDGTIMEITFELYQRENPDASLEEFKRWKALSDDLYLEEKRASWRQTHKNAYLDVENYEGLSVASAEDSYLEALESVDLQAQREQQLKLIKQALKILTKKQRRRYLMHVAHGMTIREIAVIENAAAQVVHRSIVQAKRKIQNFVFGDCK